MTEKDKLASLESAFKQDIPEPHYPHQITRVVIFHPGMTIAEFYAALKQVPTLTPQERRTLILEFRRRRRPVRRFLTWFITKIFCHGNRTR